MKHIAIVENLSGLTTGIKGGEISQQFVVKVESDSSIRYASDSGMYIIFSGETEKHYLVQDIGFVPGNYSYYVPDPKTSDYHAFTMYKDGVVYTAGTYYHTGNTYDECGSLVENECHYNEETGECELPETAHTVSLFETNLPIKSILFQPNPWYLAPEYGPGHVEVETGYGSDAGSYEPGTEEWCDCNGGTWNSETGECEMPEEGE